MPESDTVRPVDDHLSEIEAMRSIAAALSPLEPLARDRVLRWSCEKFGIAGPRPAPPSSAQVRERSEDPAGSTAGLSTSIDLAELYSSCQPNTDAEKTLVVSFWLQEIEGVSGIDAQNVNTQLKHLGHGVGNITRAFDKLMQNRPQLMIQTRKAGNTKQARKTYRVTLEGKNFVEQMRRQGTGSL